MKIAILGGTFNPIHNGHLAMARAVLKYLKPDKILFVPCYLPYHKLASSNRDKCGKTAKELAPAQHRLAMIKLAIKNNPRFAVLDIDIKVRRPTYSINTIIKLKNIYPKDTKFYFIIGADSFMDIHKWRRIKVLINLVDFVVVARPGYPISRMKKAMRFSDPVIRTPAVCPPQGEALWGSEITAGYSWLQLLPLRRDAASRTQRNRQPNYKIMAHYIAKPKVDVSSTGIRREIAANKSIKNLVPPQVKSYIYGHNLYKDLYSGSLTPLFLQKGRGNYTPAV
ncbi:MAG: nicotinate-nucleotide adenylyltransferase [Planctomycetota bacterium]